MKATYYIYEDLEEIVVENLPYILEKMGLENFRVATKKLRERSDSFPLEIIFRNDGGGVADYLLEQSYTCYIFAYDEDENTSYALANSASQRVAEAFTLLRWVSDANIKISTRPLISALEEDGLEQVRSLIGEISILPRAEEFDII